ncbi:YceI family protein [Beutenbergia cavernae DSM 12333]|uniref:YceI family protein n=1 Tax=Beutenbergia cavernae (strain ATCC BAA-8 / DSM 12333 / CCUG 43141 / JCM 11478 / NBRC 16432 / NCIMB 13614 / HKI 0122) TaxID=471853 RepID=C5C190_BEUC1|nr:YceI family protein [Beutenbergia cavernae]ACQ81500.1 YceI family protein [Beutenbergia cavernae DSM 12333]
MSTIPAGTYAIDTAHSDVAFTIRHAGIAKVRGRFTEFDGTLNVADALADSGVQVTIAASSVDTGNDQRDAHLKSSDFFSVESNPTWSFVSKAASGSDSEFTLDGELTINGVTKPIALDVEFNGAATDAFGAERVGFSATGELTRADFGITWNAPLEAGGFLLGDKVKLLLEVSAVKQA